MQVRSDPKNTSNVDDSFPVALTADAARGLRTYNANFIASVNPVNMQRIVAAFEEMRNELERYAQWDSCIGGRPSHAKAILAKLDAEE